MFDLVSRLLFPAPEPSYTVDSFPEELIWVPKSLDPQTSPPEECIPCLFLTSPSARFLIFYLHSNAEDLGLCHPFCSLLREQFQAHVLAVEYPGYGLCPGPQADEASVTDNAFVAFRFAREVLNWPLDGILLLGRSIGTGPALSIAIHHEVYGVILVSPFLSVKDICRDVVGPLANLVQERFPNKDRVPLLRSSLLVVHGKKDALIPVLHGEKLYDSCRCRKLLVCPQEMEHNTNLHADASYFVLPMLQFFALPDYCFDELKVPEWAFDKRLSPFYKGSTNEKPRPLGKGLFGSLNGPEKIAPPNPSGEPALVPPLKISTVKISTAKIGQSPGLSCCYEPANPNGMSREGSREDDFFKAQPVLSDSNFKEEDEPSRRVPPLQLQVKDLIKTKVGQQATNHLPGIEPCKEETADETNRCLNVRVVESVPEVTTGPEADTAPPELVVDDITDGEDAGFDDLQLPEEGAFTRVPRTRSAPGPAFSTSAAASPRSSPDSGPAAGRPLLI
eukprot:gnl/TRDRNA2_/TRDRNA2_28801_c0_seq1.p1 gnl/TRDRNA2_/TRDRNA2_28801_c0~~gnl/TRDRNA2_/TRDRNA2_28801_c0_seq1.p1  ORF type:complete len:557 (-),score=88.83 gnl/TRDRNA2_/TRDRNA2_28801_c0_seq1:84-1598(-)